MGHIVGIVAAVMLIIAIGASTGVVDFFFPPPQEPLVSPSLSEPAAFSSPIPYAATVTQSGDGISEPRTRFYVPMSKRGER